MALLVPRMRLAPDVEDALPPHRIAVLASLPHCRFYLEPANRNQHWHGQLIGEAVVGKERWFGKTKKDGDGPGEV